MQQSYRKIFPFLILLVLLAQAAPVQAEVDSWIGTYTQKIFPGGTSAEFAQFQNFTILVRREVLVIDNTTRRILTSGEQVPAGHTISVKLRDHVEKDIQWFPGTLITGGSFAPPYGHWILGAGDPPHCLREDRATFATDNNGTGIQRFIPYFALSVAPSTLTLLEHSGPVTCSGLDCTVHAAGNITLTVQLSSSLGKYYYSYKRDTAADTSCHPDTVPARVGKVGDLARTSDPVFQANIPGKTFRVSFTSTSSCVAHQHVEGGSCVPDACMNIPGSRSVPAKSTVDADGNCQRPAPADVCPNILNTQKSVPKNMIIDGSGNCVLPGKTVQPRAKVPQPKVPQPKVAPRRIPETPAASKGTTTVKSRPNLGPSTESRQSGASRASSNDVKKSDVQSPADSRVSDKKGLPPRESASSTKSSVRLNRKL